MGDDRALGGESFGVLGFFFEIGEGDEEGEVSVFVAGCFEAVVEIALDRFLDRKAPRLDDHATTGFGIFGKIRRTDHLLIPLGKVFRARGRDCRFGLRHNGAKNQSIGR